MSGKVKVKVKMRVRAKDALYYKAVFRHY